MAGLAVVIVIMSRFAWPEPIDTGDWGLADFVDRLHAVGLQVKVIPSRQDGEWVDNIYLSEEPDATWHCFQLKNRNVECIEQWQGAAWVKRVRLEADTRCLLSQWESSGCPGRATDLTGFPEAAAPN
jgi:hypothetical protein